MNSPANVRLSETLQSTLHHLHKRKYHKLDSLRSPFYEDLPTPVVSRVHRCMHQCNDRPTLSPQSNTPALLSSDESHAKSEDGLLKVCFDGSVRTFHLNACSLIVDHVDDVTHIKPQVYVVYKDFSLDQLVLHK